MAMDINSRSIAPAPAAEPGGRPIANEQPGALKPFISDDGCETTVVTSEQAPGEEDANHESAQKERAAQAQEQVAAIAAQIIAYTPVRHTPSCFHIALAGPHSCFGTITGFRLGTTSQIKVCCVCKFSKGSLAGSRIKQRLVEAHSVVLYP